MSRRKVCLVLVMVLVVGAWWVSQAISQPAERPAERPRRGERRRPTEEETRKRMAEWRQRSQDRMREALGASVDEWKVLSPRIEKVQTAQRQARGGSRFGMGRFSRRRRPGDRRRPEGAPKREQTAAEKTTEGLRKVLEDKESKPPAIKTALAAFRKARQKAAQDLANARKELRQVVTLRQEAQLVLMGTLD